MHDYVGVEQIRVRVAEIRDMKTGVPTLEKKRRSRAAQRPASLGWVSDLRKWFWDRGTIKDDGIAATLRIRRETLWHWDQGTKPSARSIARILKVTEGKIDPLKPRRERTLNRNGDR